MAEGIKGAHLEPIQLNPGTFSGVLTRAELKTTTLNAGSFRGEFRIRGPLSATDLTIGVLLEAEGSSSLWASETQVGDIYVFPPGIEHEARHGPRSDVATLTLPVEELLEHSVWVQPQMREAFWQEPAVFRPPAPVSSAIVDGFKVALQGISRTPEILQAPHARDALRDELIGLLLKGYSSSAGRTIPTRRTFVCSSRAVREAENYLHDNEDRPVRAPELCRHLDMTKRSLHRAFHDVVGLPPAVYLRRWRLAQVRRWLADSRVIGLNVTDAALHFGFWELGRFARQYQEHFGELPSQTVQRTNRVRHITSLPFVTLAAEVSGGGEGNQKADPQNRAIASGSVS